MDLVTGNKGQGLPRIPFCCQLEQLHSAAMDPRGTARSDRSRGAKNLRVTERRPGQRVCEVRLRLKGGRILPLDTIGHNRFAGQAPGAGKCTQEEEGSTGSGASSCQAARFVSGLGRSCAAGLSVAREGILV